MQDILMKMLYQFLIAKAKPLIKRMDTLGDASPDNRKTLAKKATRNTLDLALVETNSNSKHESNS